MKFAAPRLQCERGGRSIARWAAWAGGLELRVDGGVRSASSARRFAFESRLIEERIAFVEVIL